MEQVWDSIWDKRNTKHWPLKSKLFHFILLYKCFNFKSAQFLCNAPYTMHKLWYTLCMVDFKSAQFLCNAPCTNFVQLVQSTNFGAHLAYHFKISTVYSSHSIHSLAQYSSSVPIYSTQVDLVTLY